MKKRYYFCAIGEGDFSTDETELLLLTAADGTVVSGLFPSTGTDVGTVKPSAPIKTVIKLG
jgi:hypothetical protein